MDRGGAFRRSMNWILLLFVLQTCHGVILPTERGSNNHKTKDRTMTTAQAFNTAMSIAQNEGVMSIKEVKDSMIAFYLEMFGFDATSENIALVKNS